MVKNKQKYIKLTTNINNLKLNHFYVAKNKFYLYIENNELSIKPGSLFVLLSYDKSMIYGYSIEFCKNIPICSLFVNFFDYYEEFIKE